MTDTNDKAEHIKTIRELLGMEESDFSMAEPSHASPPPPAFNVRVPQENEVIIEGEAVDIQNKPLDHHQHAVPESAATEAIEQKKARFLSRDWVRYPIIFFVALGFFYLVLNFRSISEQFFGAVNPPKTNEEVILGNETEAFRSWIARYYVIVNYDEIVVANADPDSDGLTNMDEYHLATNPFRDDTDRDGQDDGEEVLAGTNPLYQGSQPQWQREIISEKIDRVALEGRRSYNLQSGVSGASTQQAAFIVDTARAGEISIPRLSIVLPVLWSTTFENMENDLKWGSAHHPETPYPGEFGTASIHGHSSGNYDDGGFKTAFTKINLLDVGDEVFVTVYSTEGELRKYRFIVRSEKVYSKTDPAQFNAGNGYFLNVSTSWPIGTARERYVVTTELAGL